MSNKKKEPPALRPKEPTAYDPRREPRITQQKIKRCFLFPHGGDTARTQITRPTFCNYSDEARKWAASFLCSFVFRLSSNALWSLTSASVSRSWSISENFSRIPRGKRLLFLLSAAWIRTLPKICCNWISASSSFASSSSIRSKGSRAFRSFEVIIAIAR